MKINLILGVFLAIAGSLSAGETMPETDKEAMLAVHVVNGTQDGKVAEGTPVTVNFYQGQVLIEQVTTSTDAEGNCVLTGIPEGSHIVAVAQAKHSDMAFSSSPLELQPDQKQHDLTIQVFEVAYDNLLIRTGTHHLILKKSGSDVYISEFIQLINDSDKAVLSDKYDAENNPKVIEIALPENFKDLSFSSYFHPDAIVQTKTGFYDTMAIPPGTYQAVFSYAVPLGTEAIDFTKTITLSTQNMMVFVQADCGIVTDFGEPEGQMTLNDGVTTHYYIVPVSPGSVLTFHVEGVPAPPTRQNMWIILSIVFAFVGVIVLVRLIKQSKSQKRHNGSGNADAG